MKTILPAVVALVLAATTLAEEIPSAGWFPFVKGRYWLYDGTATFVQDAKVKGKKITGWRSEVVDTAEGTGFKAALLKGHPSDLAWFQEGRARRDALIVVTAKGEYHEIDGEDAATRFAALKSTGKLGKGLVGAETILFRFPPKDGDRVGDPESVKLGPRNCWVVMGVSKGNPDPAAKGIPADREHTSVTLTYRSNPDHTNITFTAGVGITFYEYVHHGTKGDCEMRLVETGGPPAAAPMKP